MAKCDKNDIELHNLTKNDARTKWKQWKKVKQKICKSNAKIDLQSTTYNTLKIFNPLISI